MGTDPEGEVFASSVVDTVMDGGVIDAFFLGVVTGKAGDNRNVTEGDGELVSDDAGDAAVAVKEGVDADETVVELGEEAADLVDIVDRDVFETVTEGAGEGEEFIINFGAAARNMIEIFITRCSEANIVTTRTQFAAFAVNTTEEGAVHGFPTIDPIAFATMAEVEADVG